jgi:hypothetical protein
VICVGCVRFAERKIDRMCCLRFCALLYNDACRMVVANNLGGWLGGGCELDEDYFV